MSLHLHGDLGASAVQPGSISADDLAVTADGVAAPMRMLRIPAKATTSGTFIDFSPVDGSGIPAWAKEVEVVLNGVSVSGTSLLLVQLGSGSVLTAGYTSSVSTTEVGQAISGATSTVGMLASGGASATNVWSGSMRLLAASALQWVETVLVGYTAVSASSKGGGKVTLGGALDRIRVTTVNGTDSFDAGSVSIIVKG